MICIVSFVCDVSYVRDVQVLYRMWFATYRCAFATALRIFFWGTLHGEYVVLVDATPHFSSVAPYKFDYRIVDEQFIFYRWDFFLSTSWSLLFLSFFFFLRWVLSNLACNRSVLCQLLDPIHAEINSRFPRNVNCRKAVLRDSEWALWWVVLGLCIAISFSKVRVRAIRSFP